jgi:hypothetical protein
VTAAMSKQRPSTTKTTIKDERVAHLNKTGREIFLFRDSKQ